ncbi:MAG: V-type ATP synthase subunit E [Candidatus Altiarchaeota archaeon]|nr:V-type ATP synthase subunit E [Candidatus Altiarchaeota archaeon]
MNSNLDKIEKKIRETGKKEIEAIEKDAGTRITHIKKEISEEAGKAYTEALEKRKSELELVPRRILSEARMKKKKEIDAKKTGMVAKVFEESRARILKMSRKEKADILKNLAANGSKDISDPVIYVDKEYSDLIDAKTENLGDFGVVVRSKDGSSSVDNTLNSVMGRLQLDLKPAIVKTLFTE